MIEMTNYAINEFYQSGFTLKDQIVGAMISVLPRDFLSRADLSVGLMNDLYDRVVEFHERKNGRSGYRTTISHGDRGSGEIVFSKHPFPEEGEPFESKRLRVIIREGGYDISEEI